MYTPHDAHEAFALTILSALFWGSWANSYKGTRAYPFALFYWDYIAGVVLCALVLAFTLGSHGASGEPFLINLRATSPSNLAFALLAGMIFNVANTLLVAAIEIAGLAIAFPIAIGIAVVEGVVLSYALQPKGDVALLGGGVLLALIAVLFNARAHRALQARRVVRGDGRSPNRTGIIVSIVSGVLMGGFAPLVTRAMTHGHAMTSYSVAVLFALGALLCCAVFNAWLMKHPLTGAPVSLSAYRQAGGRNHLLGLVGGIAWGLGGCFNFIAAGYVGVPISYAIGQTAPLIAAAWGVFVWREFAGAPPSAWRSLALMASCYVAAILFIALAYRG